MTLYLTLYDADNGNALSDGFKTRVADFASEDSAKVALLTAALESLGYTFRVSNRALRGKRTAPEAYVNVGEW